MKMNKQSYQEEFDMNTSFISTQQIKDLINEQKFTSTKDIMDCMKNMFADVLEQTLQAEMDQHLGYEHAERRNDDAKKNYRNGSVKRTMKHSWVKLKSMSPETATENSNQRSSQSISAMQMVSRNVSSPFMLPACLPVISRSRSKVYMMWRYRKDL